MRTRVDDEWHRMKEKKLIVVDERLVFVQRLVRMVLGEPNASDCEISCYNYVQDYIFSDFEDLDESEQFDTVKNLMESFEDKIFNVKSNKPKIAVEEKKEKEWDFSFSQDLEM